MASAVANKGFYIARYETGVKGVRTSDKNTKYTITNADESTTTIDKDGSTSKPIIGNETYYKNYLVSKKDTGVWNKINQLNAAALCQNMYEEGSGVISDLMNGYAWDTAIIFIQECSGKSDYSNSSDGDGIIKETGEKGDEKCKINDMASNMREWTTESCTYLGSPCLGRGGFYYSDRKTHLRGYSTTTYAIGSIGFRPLLYLEL